MTWWQATLWGLAGGGAAAVLGLSAAIVSAGYTWPWRREGDLAPRLFVLAAGLLLGALVAAAAHDQISGAWPAFIFGIGAPATIRGILAGVEVIPHARPTPARISPKAARSGPPLQTTDPVSSTVPEGDADENTT